METWNFNEWKRETREFLVDWLPEIRKAMQSHEGFEAFLAGPWFDWEEAVGRYIGPHIVSKLAKEETPYHKEIVKHIINIMNIKEFLGASMDGETSLGGREHLEALYTQMKVLSQLLADDETIDISALDADVVEILEERLLSSSEGQDPDATRQVDLEKTVVEVPSPNLEDRPAVRPVTKPSPSERPRPSEKPRTTVGRFDSGLYQVDPITGSAVVSLSRPKVKGTRPVEYKPSHWPALELLKSTVERASDKPTGQLEALVEHLASEILRLRPTEPRDLAMALLDADARMVMRYGSSAMLKKLARERLRKIMNEIERTINSGLEMAPTSLIQLYTERIPTDDEYTMKFHVTATAGYDPRLLSGDLTFTLTFKPPFVYITATLEGFPPPTYLPFGGTPEAHTRLGWHEGTPTLAASFVLRCITAWLQEI